MHQGTKRLPRRRNARSGELDLEKACEERIDAVTAEPLLAGKFIEVLSPDKSLKLFYNTSTLIRIAMDKGKFMQPPHFREPMDVSMQRRVEQIEGKTFHFEARDHFLPAADDDVEATLAGAAGGLSVHHRHVYFDQIADEFYLLNPAELYVCSVCYEHYVQTRFIPAETRDGHRIDYLERDGEAQATAVLDPLDVLTHMAQPTDTDESDSPLVHTTFRYAVQWKKHMKIHHAITGISAEDYTVRARLCNFYSHFNQRQTERYEARLEMYGTAKARPALTQQRYWMHSAGYNRLRYNRLVEGVEARQADPETYEVSAFPGEDIATETNPAAEDEDDFICDDSESSDDDDNGHYPHYSPRDSDDEDESEEVEEVAPRQSRKPLAGRKRARATPSQSTTSSPHSDVSSSVTPSTDSASGEDEEDEEDEEDPFVARQIEKQKNLFRRGLLAERDCYDERLSAEDRRFLDHESRRATNAAKSTLYDPQMATLRGGPPTSSSFASSMDLNDWANIGETLQSPHSLQIASAKTETAAATSPVPPQFRTSAMLLDDE